MIEITRIGSEQNWGGYRDAWMDGWMDGWILRSHPWFLAIILRVLSDSTLSSALLFNNIL
jgi:hypothetical protein